MELTSGSSRAKRFAARTSLYNMRYCGISVLHSPGYWTSEMTHTALPSRTEKALNWKRRGFVRWSSRRKTFLTNEQHSSYRSPPPSAYHGSHYGFPYSSTICILDDHAFTGIVLSTILASSFGEYVWCVFLCFVTHRAIPCFLRFKLYTLL